MKIKGAELALFMTEAWPHPQITWDHELFADHPEPEETYDTSNIEGLFWGGRKEDKPFDGSHLPLDPLITAWRLSRAYTPVLLRVPRPDADPAHLPPVDDVAIAAAAQFLLGSEKACADLAAVLASNRMLPPGMAIKAALTTIAERDAGLRIHLPVRPLTEPAETNLIPDMEP